MEPDMTEQIYRFIKDYVHDQRISPSYKEIADACYISISTVDKHLSKLEWQGRIARLRHQPRSIRLLDEDE